MLEHLCKNAKIPKKELLEQFQEEFTLLMHDLKNYLEHGKNSKSIGQKSEYDSGELTKQISGLTELIDNDTREAISRIDALLKNVSGTKYEAIIEEIAHHLNIFDLDSAQEAIKKLEQQLKEEHA